MTSSNDDARDLVMTGPHLPPEASEEEQRLLRRAVLLKQTTLTVAVLILLALLASTTWTVFQIRSSQRTNANTVHAAADAAKAAHQGTNRIEACTTPGRGCYERGQRQASSAIGGLNTVTVRAVACSLVLLRAPDSQALTADAVARQIKACVKHGTTALGVTGQPSTGGNQSRSRSSVPSPSPAGGRGRPHHPSGQPSHPGSTHPRHNGGQPSGHPTPRPGHGSKPPKSTFCTALGLPPSVCKPILPTALPTLIPLP